MNKQTTTAPYSPHLATVGAPVRVLCHNGPSRPSTYYAGVIVRVTQTTVRVRYGRSKSPNAHNEETFTLSTGLKRGDTASPLFGYTRIAEVIEVAPPPPATEPPPAPVCAFCVDGDCFRCKPIQARVVFPEHTTPRITDLGQNVYGDAFVQFVDTTGSEFLIAVNATHVEIRRVDGDTVHLVERKPLPRRVGAVVASKLLRGILPAPLGALPGREKRE